LSSGPDNLVDSGSSHPDDMLWSVDLGEAFSPATNTQSHISTVEKRDMQQGGTGIGE